MPGHLNIPGDTLRQRHEKDHYDARYRQIAAQTPTFSPKQAALAPLLRPEERPYEPDWQFVQQIRGMNLQGKTVLELGCGTGQLTYLIAEMGAHVFAIDISQEAINVARIRLHHYGREDAVSFEAMTVESLHYPDAMFDVVVGEYILHHVEVDLSAAQISRVLKPGGQAIFFEPKNGSRPCAFNVEVVIIVQHAQRRRGR